MILRTTCALTCLVAVALFPSCGESGTSENFSNDTVVAQTKYDKETTLLSLCFLSNITSGYIDSSSTDRSVDLQHKSDSLMTALLDNDTVVNYIGNWQIVWGPCLYNSLVVDGYTASDLCMVLLKGRDPDDTAKTMYVLSMSGTNNASLYDWLYPDLKVTSMFEWPATPEAGQNNTLAFVSARTTSDNVTDTNVTNSGVYVSTGMALGMDVLFNDMVNNNGNGKSLLDYLKANVNAEVPTEIAVTGHSMGGALSPCAALVLKDNQSYWDSNGMFNITVYPFAGPSPGNANFATYFQNRIGPENFHGRYNSYDAAPFTFNSRTLQKIASMYDSVAGFPQNQCMAAGIFNCIAQQVQGFNYTSLYGPDNAFPGTVSLPGGADSLYSGEYAKMTPFDQAAVNTFILQFSQCNGISQDTVLAHFGCFGTLVIQQHFDAYRDYFHCDSVFNRIQQAQGPGPSEEQGGFLLGRIIMESLLGKCQ